MARLRVAAIVEGHGEVRSVPILLERIWREVCGGEFLDVMRPPIRQPKNRLLAKNDHFLVNAVSLAAAKLDASVGMNMRELILILIDADEDPPCILGPRLLQTARQARSDKPVSCVLANVEFETWFVAAASSLTDYLDTTDDDIPIRDPETSRLRKAWIEKRFKGPRYSGTLDQPRLTAKMDLLMCRDNSPSFDKLCRELEQFAAT